MAVALVFAALAQAAYAKDYLVSTAQEIADLAATLQPGDEVVLRDGTWKDTAVIIRAVGTAEKPVVFRAQTPGKVIFSGKSPITIVGEYVVLSGVRVENAESDEDQVSLHGQKNRLTDSAVLDCNAKYFVRMYGSENRVDHCYFAGKTTAEPTLQVEALETPNHHRIDNNYFGPRPPLGRNGGETLRVGYSRQSMNSSRTVVESNLFYRCDGEIEIISNKSCDNIYRSNTFVDCDGMLTLRHGDRCRVEGNFFFGRGKAGSGGVRVIGEGHVVINNYIEGVTKGGFWITAGIPNSPLTGYYKAKDVVIAFNTFVDSQGPAVDLSNGFGKTGRTLLPENILIANNLFVPSEKAKLLLGQEGERYEWRGNLTTSVQKVPQPGIQTVDAPLSRSADGLWRPGPNSPARGAAVVGREKVEEDIDGQPRVGASDVGCDQVSDAPVRHRPLAAKDVGPTWWQDP